MRVANTRVMLDSIVAAFEQGHSPETIRNQYPSLTLEQVYGAITYYLANRDEVLDYLKRQDAVWAEWEGWSRSRPSPLLERLRARRVARPDHLSTSVNASASTSTSVPIARDTLLPFGSTCTPSAAAPSAGLALPSLGASSPGYVLSQQEIGGAAQSERPSCRMC